MFQNNFSNICQFWSSKLFLNFNKTLFDLRSLCIRFLRFIYLTADGRLKQITLQPSLVSLFSFCMLEAVTTLLSSHVIDSITNFSSNTPKRSENTCNPLNFPTLLLQIWHRNDENIFLT